MSDPTPQTTPTRDEAVREAIVTALRRFGGIAVLARKPDAIGFIAEIAAREVAALAPAPASGGVDAWRDMASAPKNATEIILRLPCKGWPGHYSMIGHWAQDLSGEEQPPFRGWFWRHADGFAQLPEPTGWKPLSPAATPVSEAGGGGPTYVVNCCNCGRIVDTRERDAGGDGFGAELADEERWVCSPECWDAVVEPDPAKPSPAGGDVREAATAFDKLVSYGVRRSDRHGTGTLFLLAGGHSFFLSDIDRDAIRSSLSQSTSGRG